MQVLIGIFKSAVNKRVKVGSLFSREPSSKVKIFALGTLLAGICIVYFLFGTRFNGPAILLDEIGYLMKAALITGNVSDAASSFRGGYSLFIAPAFLLFSDPSLIWKAVIFINSLLFTASFYCLYRLLRKLFVNQSFWNVLLAIAVTAVYPAWVIMTGYAFATPAFIFVFMLSTLVTVSHRLDSRAKSVLLGLLTGFLYWIHPLGLVPVGVIALLLSIDAIQKRKIESILIFLIVVICVIGAYSFVVHPWMANVMTPGEYHARDHYAEVVGRYQTIFDPEVWLGALIIALGRLSYVLISTLGLAAFAYAYLFEKARDFVLAKKRGLTSENLALFYSLLAVLGIIAFSSLTAGSDLSIAGVKRVDHWIYGRYTEMVLPPLIGIGVLSVWRFRYSIYSATLVLVSGIAISLFSTSENTQNSTNAVTIPAFWPEAIFRQTRFLLWFALGAGVILLVSKLGRKYLLPMFLIALIFCVNRQFEWHHFILSDYSKPSDLVKVVREKATDTTCIGMEAGHKYMSYEMERLRMYTFYFYDFNLQRMTNEQWLNGSCDYYLTYNVDMLLNEQIARVIGREEKTGLHLLIKDTQ